MVRLYFEDDFLVCWHEHLHSPTKSSKGTLNDYTTECLA